MRPSSRNLDGLYPLQPGRQIFQALERPETLLEEYRQDIQPQLFDQSGPEAQRCRARAADYRHVLPFRSESRLADCAPDSIRDEPEFQRPGLFWVLFRRRLHRFAKCSRRSYASALHQVIWRNASSAAGRDETTGGGKGIQRTRNVRPRIVWQASLSRRRHAGEHGLSEKERAARALLGKEECDRWAYSSGLVRGGVPH